MALEDDAESPLGGLYSRLYVQLTQYLRVRCFVGLIVYCATTGEHSPFRVHYNAFIRLPRCPRW